MINVGLLMTNFVEEFPSSRLGLTLSDLTFIQNLSYDLTTVALKQFR
jgi:hypothetical protein